MEQEKRKGRPRKEVGKSDYSMSIRMPRADKEKLQEILEDMGMSISGFFKMKVKELIKANTK